MCLQAGQCARPQLHPTPMKPPRPPRELTPAQLAGYEHLCDQLAGFDGPSLAEVDGYLAVLACAPGPTPPDTWLDDVFGDSFERAFADPEAHSQALEVVLTRLGVLRDHLDPDILLDWPDELRLGPYLDEWTDEEAAEMARAQSEHATEDGSADDLADKRVDHLADHPDEAEDDAAGLPPIQAQTGILWASGALRALETQLPQWGLSRWAQVEEALPDYQAPLQALLLPPDSDDFKAYLAVLKLDDVPERETLLGDACLALQDLRLLLLDHAPTPEQRLVGDAPGRNDLCHCGSGRKFKKCHGA